MKSTGTHLAIWANLLGGITTFLANDTSWMQLLGSHAGYAASAVLIANSVAHALTGQTKPNGQS
jgi:hypothetical protein